MIVSRMLSTRSGSAVLTALALLAALAISGCSGKQEQAGPAGTGAATPAAGGDAADEPKPPLAYESGLHRIRARRTQRVLQGRPRRDGERRVKVTFGVPVSQMSTFRTALLRGVTPMPDGTHDACELSVNRLIDECLRLEFGPAPDTSPPPESPRPIGRPTLTPGNHLKCVGAYLPASFVAFLRAQAEADPEKPTIAALIRGAVDQYAPALRTRQRPETALKTPVSGSTWVRTSVHLSPEQLSLLESAAEQMHITSAHALRLCVGYHIKSHLKAKESE